MGKTKKNRSSVPLGSSLDDKVDLVQLLSNTDLPPSEEVILALLSARFKADLPYIRINASSLVVINPNKPLEIMNDASAKEYADHWYRDTSGTNTTLQPHIFEFAARIYLHMRRSAEDQSVIFRSVNVGHLLSQLLLLSTHTKKEAKLANQIQNAQIILEAFGNVKTVQNINASRFGKYLELQFNEKGRIVGSKALTYCFDKYRVTKIPPNERSYHVFYYLLAGATSEERSSFHLQDPQSYNYLAQSKCYKIPDVDDGIQMEDLRAALKNLGFKSRTIAQIWQVLSAILLLGNIEFIDHSKANDEAADIKNHHVLDMVAQYLGVPAFKLTQTLTYRTKLIGKDLCTAFLNAEAAAEQRDALSRALYYILFTWIVEHINSKLIHSDEPPNFISLLDQPGSQNFAKNGFEEFCLNLATEEIENYVLKRIFDDHCGFSADLTNDGIRLPNVPATDNNRCVELLRGDGDVSSTSESNTTRIGGLISSLNLACEKVKNGVESIDDPKLLSSVQQTFSSHPSFVSESGAFGINHFTGKVTYTLDGFIEKNNDSLSPDFINLFHDTNNSFIRKLFSGPALAIENHPKSDKTVVMAQLPSKPMRAPSMKRPKRSEGRPAEDSEEKVSAKKSITHVSTVVTQLHGTMRQLIDTLNQTRLWNTFHIRPNNANDPDAFDDNHVLTQIRSFLIPSIVSRKRFEYTSQHTFEDFLTRYEPIIRSHNLEASQNLRENVEAFASAIGWSEDEFAIGQYTVSLSDTSWKSLEDHLRYLEKEERARSKQTKDDDSLVSGAFPGEGRKVNTSSAGSSVDRLLPKSGVTYAGSDAGYYDSQSYVESEDEYENSRSGSGNYAEDDEGNMWGGDGYLNAGDSAKKVPDDGEKGKEEVEDIRVSSSRKWWVRFVWLCTWWIPSFLMRWIGKMKRPDVRLAWREKFTLCFLIFLLSSFITFYIIFFGNLLCPGTDKVYSSTDVSYHTGDTDFWVSVRGVVYDLSAFHMTDHANNAPGLVANQAAMQPFGGTDATTSIPVPLNQPDSCGSLVTSSLITVQHTNQSDMPSFIHNTPSTIYPNSHLADARWYWDYFLPTMQFYKKATLVWETADVAAQGLAGRKWAIIKDNVYDLTDYFATISSNPGNNAYHYLNSGIETLFNVRAGQDVTAQVYGNQISATDRANNM
ncbi:6358_t:CDS:2, partial [Acaulospora colombiana]